MQSLSRYSISEVIHAGSVHVLHRGYRNEDHAQVILKVLRSEAPSLDQIARLRHEFVIAQQIDAPGVVKALGLEPHGRGLALILEDFGGRPLDEILREGRPDLKTALDIASGLAEAVG